MSYRTPAHYDIVVFGEPNVGKTCFIDQFCFGMSYVVYDPDDGISSRQIVVDEQAVSLTLMDLSTSFLKPEHGMSPIAWAEQMLANAQGMVLLYDITSLDSFQYVTDQAYKFLWDCRRVKCEHEEADEEDRKIFGCVLVGGKVDLASESRQVDQILAEEWAQSQGIKSIEVDSLDQSDTEDAMKLLVRNIRKIERLTGIQASGMEMQGGGAKGKGKSSIRSTLRGLFKSPTT